MIVGVFSGYYRSGTTAWQKAISEAGVLVLHEPFTPSLRKDLWSDRAKKLHGWDVFEDYFKLEPHVLARLWHELKYLSTPVVTDFDSIKRVVEILDKSDKEVVVKDNQMWPFLDEISAEFGIPTLFLERNPYDVVLAHVEIFPNPEKVLNSRTTYDRCFYCDSVHRLLGGKLKQVRDKILWNVTTAKKRAGGKHVHYEKPEEVVKALKKWGLDVKPVKPIKPRNSTSTSGICQRS